MSLQVEKLEKNTAKLTIEVPADAQEKDPLVFLWTEILPLSGRVPGAWTHEGEDPDEKG